jgi:ribosomal protein S18 acetylase RimI-like enzyme
MLAPVMTVDASPHDWAGIWSILRRVAAAGETFCWPRDISEEQARAIWTAPAPNLTLVVRDDAGVVGTATLHPNQDGPAAHVANASFAVDPRARGRGVGRRLATDTLDRARAEGYRAMQFNAVVETNRGAVALWESLGFRVLATVPDAFLHPTAGYVGLHVMHRPL